MTIVTWNCNMAFRKKAGYILAAQPDIVIVPECEHPEKLQFVEGIEQPTDSLWFGTNQHKGLGIFSYSHFRFTLHDMYNPAFKMIVPIQVHGGPAEFILYAVWTNNPQDPEGQYVEQVWKAVQYYDALLHNQTTVLAGDFNSNTIWDRKYRIGNHSHLVQRLHEKGIMSCYHFYHQQEQGKEKHPTLYLYRHKDKPYHLDYCFASGDLIKRIQSVEIGESDFWLQYSDHVPLIVRFDNL